MASEPSIDLDSLTLLELTEYYAERNRKIFGDVRERMKEEQERELNISRKRIKEAIERSRNWARAQRNNNGHGSENVSGIQPKE